MAAGLDQRHVGAAEGQARRRGGASLFRSFAPASGRLPRAQCLYIGNGPSLNKLDWSFLNAAKLPVVMGARRRCGSRFASLLLTRPTAGVNKIYLGFQRFNIRVNYLACTNRRSACPACLAMRVDVRGALQ